ncbi:MAG: hypothetical protein ACYC5M_11580 [Anaerolineae bacterium]
MKSEFSAYLESIGMGEVYVRRVGEIVSFYQNLFGEDEVDIFVSEYVQENDDRRVYESLWILTPSWVGEAKGFLDRDDFDWSALNEVRYWKIEKKEYDFRKASDRSRCTLRFTLSWTTAGSMKSSGYNCDYLKQILIKYMLPMRERALLQQKDS